MRLYIAFLLALLFAITTSAQNISQQRNSVYYRGIMELSGGAAYNLNTAQTISAVNMQMLCGVSTSHGIHYKGMFGGLGIGYNYSQRDKENMYLAYGDFRYCFDNIDVTPSLGLKAGIIYDPYWIESVQKYLALGASLDVYRGLRIGVEGVIFSRPSRHFTANAQVVLGYSFGR